ncbi:hypothetical protein [Hyphomonas sp.]|uniref:head-tail connector protein n=1 Tax=Hyphomonas sp. TaxID=87 RepID=UPI00391B1448
MTELTVVTPPAGEPLPLAAAKEFLRLGTDAEDALVARLIAAGRAQIESASGLALVERTLRRRWHRWPDGLMRQGIVLRPGPAHELVSVVRKSPAGGDDTITERFLLMAGRLRLKRAWGLPMIPLDGWIEVTFTTGFGPPGNVPPDLAHAVKVWVQTAYLRGGPSPLPALPDEVRAILDARREWAI